jgi:hypothetical protein
MNLNDLSLPFPPEDIEWRVSRAGNGRSGAFCMVLAYITARAIQKRLDDVCGPEHWRLEAPRILEINNKSAFACGISIRVTHAALSDSPETEWITKWDVAEPTNVEPAKGGFSGAMKRAGAQWGIGRYLYHLDETFAETAETSPDKNDRRWKYAKLPEKAGGGVYYWKSPGLPAWALPKEPEHEVSAEQLGQLKKEWRLKFAPDSKDTKELREGFDRFVHSVCGEFPVADHTCWTGDAVYRCSHRIESTKEPGGVSADVPFTE